MLLPNSGIENHPDGTGNLNPIVNGNWETLNNWINPGEGKTVRLDNGTAGNAGTVLTFSADVLLGVEAGSYVRFADGTTVLIDSVTDASHAVSSTSGDVEAQEFELYRTDQTAYTALARGLTKRTQLTASENTQILQWDSTAKYFQFVDKPGYSITAGRVLFGGGTGANLASSASLTWNDSTKLLTATGTVHVSEVIYSDIATTNPATGAITLDFATANTFLLVLSGNVTLGAPSNAKVGAKYRVLVKEDGTGGHTVAFNAVFKFPQGYTAVAMAANGLATFECLCTATNEFLVTAIAGANLGTPTLSNLVFVPGTTTYGASVALDCNGAGYQTISLTGNLTLTSLTNQAAGKSLTIRLIADGSLRTLTFPANWKFLGVGRPASIAASKTAILTLTAFGATDADVLAAYSVES